MCIQNSNRLRHIFSFVNLFSFANVRQKCKLTQLKNAPYIRRHRERGAISFTFLSYFAVSRWQSSRVEGEVETVHTRGRAVAVPVINSGCLWRILFSTCSGGNGCYDASVP